MARFGLNLSINPFHVKWLDFGAFTKNKGIGTVEFIVMGSTKSFALKIER